MVLDLQIRIARVLIKIGDESEGIKTRDSRDLGGIARNYRASSWTEEEEDGSMFWFDAPSRCRLDHLSSALLS